MRRQDREITDPKKIDEILRRGECLHLGLCDGQEPYVVPLNYGFERQNGRVVFYFHGAREGKKLEIIRKNPRAAFCVDVGHQLDAGDAACEYSYFYESVMGRGTVTVLEELEEKRRGLARIFAQYVPDKPFDGKEQALAAVTVLRLEAECLSGKRR